MLRFSLGLLTLALLQTVVASQGKDHPFQEYQFAVLQNKKVQRELELVDDQQKKLKDLSEKYRRDRQVAINELKKLKAEGASSDEIEKARQHWIEKLTEMSKGLQKDLLKTLLPHQAKRLRQLTAQVMIRETQKKNKNPSGLLTPQMMSFLEIDDKQAEKIRKRTKELQVELAEKYQKLIEESRKKLLDQLSESQKKKYKELVGQQFDFQKKK